MQTEQMREDAQWARSESRIMAHLAAQCGTLDDEGNQDCTAASMRFDRVASYAERLAQPEEGLVAMRDGLLFDAGQLRKMLHCTEGDLEYRQDERDADKDEEWAAELTALLAEGQPDEGGAS